MQRWQGRVAVVTGASAGIGAVVCRDLVAHGLTVVGLARREDRLQELSKELEGSTGKFHYRKTDVTNEEEVLATFSMVNKEIGGVDVLINNAGVGFTTLVKDCEMEKWESMFRLNVLALGMCTREALNSMRNRGVDDGHIINISSVAAHRVSNILKAGVYCATKTAARVLTEALRRELVDAKSRIKVTNISPGCVETEFFDVGSWDFIDLNKIPHLPAMEVAKAVHYALDTPPDTQTGNHEGPVEDMYKDVETSTGEKQSNRINTDDEICSVFAKHRPVTRVYRICILYEIMEFMNQLKKFNE